MRLQYPISIVLYLVLFLIIHKVIRNEAVVSYQYCTILSLIIHKVIRNEAVVSYQYCTILSLIIHKVIRNEAVVSYQYYTILSLIIHKVIRNEAVVFYLLLLTGQSILVYFSSESATQLPVLIGSVVRIFSPWLVVHNIVTMWTCTWHTKDLFR